MFLLTPLSFLSRMHTINTMLVRGNILDGTLHGRGEAEYANGERFEGVSGRPCGGGGKGASLPFKRDE